MRGADKYAPDGGSSLPPIPDKAIDAGTEAYLKTIRDFQEQFGGDDMPHPEHCIRAALEAAVPYLTADAETVAAKWELNCKVSQAERDELIRERDRLREEIDRAHHFGTDSGL